MATAQQIESTGYVNRAVEVSIHIGLLILMAAACFLILRPFLTLIAWGIILAIAVYPRYRKLRGALGGRSALSAVLVCVILLGILIVPVALVTGTVIEGIQNLAAQLKNGTPIIPPPPARIESWPVIGVRLANAWNLASTNVATAIDKFAPQIKAFLGGLLSASAGVGLAVLQFTLSIVIAGVLLGHWRAAGEAAHSLACRIFGVRGQEFEDLAAATIRSVTSGILGVALIQSILAGIGFVVAGMPGAGIWAVVFLFSAVLQVGTLVLIPAAIYMFAIASATKASLFLIWCVVVAALDNILKPILLGRGVAVPIAVVFLGAIGGFVAMGILGLFVGAIVLSVGYKLLLAWLDLVPAPSPGI